MLSAGLTNILYMVGGLAGLVIVLYCVIRRQLYLDSDTVLFSVFLLFFLDFSYRCLRNFTFLLLLQIHMCVDDDPGGILCIADCS